MASQDDAWTDRSIEIATRAEGTQAVLEVQDDGVGIPPHLLPQVFELFFQADRSLDRSQGGWASA